MPTNTPPISKQPPKNEQSAQTNQKQQESCIKCFVILGSVNVICAGGMCYWLGGHSLISFEVGYISTLLILLSSLTSLKSTIKKEMYPKYYDKSTPKELLDSSHTNNDQESNPSAPDKSQTHTLSRFVLGLKISFGAYRILAYIILIIGLVILINYEVFAVIGYIAGVMLCVLSAILFKLKHS